MRRAIIVALAILVTLPVLYKSRVKGFKPDPAAFSVISEDMIQIQISGDVCHPGIYSLGANIMTASAIKMAAPERQIKNLLPPGIGERRLLNGEHMKLYMQTDDTAVVTVGAVSSRERMLLGVPLDINVMEAADFELLPGIGPVVAQRIVEYRQKNGGKMTIENLHEVEGIGEKKYNSIRPYF